MPKLGWNLAATALSLLAFALPGTAGAEQFVLIDVTFTFTKEDALNSKPSPSHYYCRDAKIAANRPKNWTAPVDYRQGTVHIRTEILDKPAGGQPCSWSLCYIPNQGRKNGYGCTHTGVYEEKGVVERDEPMTKFWENESIVWSKGREEGDGLPAAALSSTPAAVLRRWCAAVFGPSTLALQRRLHGLPHGTEPA